MTEPMKSITHLPAHCGYSWGESRKRRFGHYTDEMARPIGTMAVMHDKYEPLPCQNEAEGRSFISHAFWLLKPPYTLGPFGMFLLFAGGHLYVHGESVGPISWLGLSRRRTETVLVGSRNVLPRRCLFHWILHVSRDYCRFPPALVNVSGAASSVGLTDQARDLAELFEVAGE